MENFNAGRGGIENWCIRGRWDFESGASAEFLYAQTKSTATGGSVKAYEVGLSKPHLARFRLNGEYTYMDGNAVVAGAKTHQVNTTLHYQLSRRTNLYSSFAYQKVGGGDGSGKANLLLSGGPSNGTTQNVLRFGIFDAFMTVRLDAGVGRVADTLLSSRVWRSSGPPLSGRS